MHHGSRQEQQSRHESADDQRPEANDRDYCTTSVIGVVCEKDPELAVTFTV